MRTVREPSPWLQVITFFGALLVGPYSALQVSRLLAPGSGLVETLAIFGFAGVFVGGTVLWMGLGVATVLVNAVWSLLRGRRPGTGSMESGQTVVPPGYRSFVVLGIVVGLGVGLLCGLVAEVGVVTATGAWTLLGSTYGTALWAAAHHGCLPFPEPE